MTAVEITVTGPADWMEGCVADLLDARLIACAHMLPIRSRYWWGNRIETAIEQRGAMHTLEGNFVEINRVVQRSHPYEVACVISQPIDPVAPEYAQWIVDNVTPSVLG